MVQDEGERVKEAYAGTKVGGEAYRENNLDVAERTTRLEKKIDKIHKGKKADDWGETDV